MIVICEALCSLKNVNAEHNQNPDLCGDGKTLSRTGLLDMMASAVDLSVFCGDQNLVSGDYI